MNTPYPPPPPFDRNCIIDLSHHNGDAHDFARTRTEGIVGVIHKASQGLSLGDAMYGRNRAAAVEAGLLWGAYHFGTGADGVAQADHFLDATGDPAGVLMALDLEPNPSGPSMDLAQARAFVVRVHDRTGRWPGLYSGHTIKALLGARHDAVLANCWLWLAQYGPRAVVPANWQTWTLWQYTDGTVGGDPKSVAGIGRCDRSRFNGTEANLRKLWRGG